MKFGFGIDLGGTTIKIAYLDDTGTLRDKWEIPTVVANGGQQILPDIAASIRTYLQKQDLRQTEILGLGIGVPGPVNSRGVVNRCVNLGWGVLDVARELSALTGLPVKAGNDANVAALGEFWKGGGRGYDNMVFVTLGTGVGGGIVVEGKLLHGAHGSGAEIGHICVNPHETVPCSCGNYGCVEQYCSATGIMRLAKGHLARTGAPSMLRNIEELTCKDIFDCARAGDAAATAVLDQFYRYMGRFLAGLCSTIDPDVVVIGGGVSNAGDMLLQGLEPYFRRHVFHAADGVTFALATLGNDAGAYGAFKLALDAFT